MEFGTGRLIIDLSITGHHTIYIKHVLNYFKNNINEITEDKTIFVFHEEVEEMFKDVINVIKKKNHNIEFIYVSGKKINELKRGNVLKVSVRQTMFLKSIIMQKGVTNAILLDMNIYQFGLIFVKFPDFSSIKGIIFSQYFRQNKNGSIKNLYRYIKRYYLLKLLIKKKYIKKVFFLNDEKGVKKEKGKLKTSKLYSIPDPIEQIDIEKLVDIRKKYDIPVNHKILLHYGSMAIRKGSLEIPNAIKSLGSAYKDKFTLIYAGTSSDKELQMNINNELKKIKNQGYSVINMPYFIDLNLTNSLFIEADACLIPYTSVEASSGSLGHSIASNTTVIGPNKGLLGELIEESKLGLTMNKTDYITISNTLAHFLEGKEVKKGNNVKVLEERSPEKFVEKLLVK